MKIPIVRVTVRLPALAGRANSASRIRLFFSVGPKLPNCRSFAEHGTEWPASSHTSKEILSLYRNCPPNFTLSNLYAVPPHQQTPIFLRHVTSAGVNKSISEIYSRICVEESDFYQTIPKSVRTWTCNVLLETMTIRSSAQSYSAASWDLPFSCVDKITAPDGGSRFMRRKESTL